MIRQYWRVFALTFAIMAVGAYQLYGVFSNKGYEPVQPINYSHVLHAGVMQMECLYCHSQAEKGPSAGIPGLDVCMGCHAVVRTDSPEIQKMAKYYAEGKPVPWVRIHRIPDHAFFNHRWHVEAGVACQTCHGPVQNMPVVHQWTKLEMGKCVECHRQGQYAGQIDHPPTFHEPEVTAAEVASAPEGLTLAGAEENPQWASAAAEFKKYHDSSAMSPDDTKVMLTRLKQYQEDIYQHGRQYQTRGKNASVECSTCHY
ncbi:cytochrome c3 family protein [Candidatus Sumerlaeota bacterium]|nr:cytochrome c3 family protein [Candidatus Sumerlaeota bacterium]